MTGYGTPRGGNLMPEFLIAGTPRSGTTLVQRLASELPGVRVPPETHFFTEFYRGLRQRSRFPLDETALRKEIRIFSGLTTSRGLDIDHDQLVDLLGGRCSSPTQLYGAITRALAGPARLVGEKTPDHLRWWRLLVRAHPCLKFVFVSRDPRGVVASRVEAGWGDSIPQLLAERWRVDQQEIIRAMAHLPERSWALFRYEDIVIDPDAARSRLATFLGVELEGWETATEDDSLFQSWESWKDRALQPVTTERTEAWTSILSETVARDVIRRCRTEAIRLGYETEASPHPLRMPLRLWFRATRMRFSRWRERLWIRAQTP